MQPGGFKLWVNWICDWCGVPTMAQEKPSQVKDSSVADASATPPMMGISAAYTGHAYTVPVSSGTS
jgi:hypothetical protein